MFFSRLKKSILRIYSRSSSSRFIKYLRKKGACIGKNSVFLSPNKTFVDEGRAPFINIGDNCVICSGVTILAHDYSWSVLIKSHEKILPSGGGPVSIGNNVFLGVNSMILRNVTLGNNVIVAAGSVVTKSFEDNVVIGGNPAIKICTLDEFITRRQEKYLDELKMNILFIKEKYGRDPIEQELGNFRFLWSKEIVSQMLAIDSEVLHKVVKKNTQLFTSFEEMLELMKMDRTL